MNNCIFCKIISGSIPCSKVYEDAYTIAFLDVRPVNKGHVLVVPKKHCVNVFDCDEQTWEQLAVAVQKVAAAVQKGTGVSAVNINSNNGEASGQAVMHAHTHIIPRYADDGLKLWHGKEYAAGEMEAYAQKIAQGI